MHASSSTVQVSVPFWVHLGRSSFDVFADSPLRISVVLIAGFTEETRYYHQPSITSTWRGFIEAQLAAV
jgi:hypothetical protein